MEVSNIQDQKQRRGFTGSYTPLKSQYRGLVVIVLPQAPVLPNIQCRSSIRVVQRCTEVSQGGAGSSVMAGGYKRETSAASFPRGSASGKFTHLCSNSTLDSGLCLTRNKGFKINWTHR